MADEHYEAYVLDIEGTLCPLSFVKDTLYPFFVLHVQRIVYENFNVDQPKDSFIAEHLLKFGIKEEGQAGKNKLVEKLLDMVANDIKDSTLKALQGHVWEVGYNSGEIEVPLYPDVIDFLVENDGREKKIPVYIYSSGSIQAQKLLFGHVKNSGNSHAKIAGNWDLNRFIDGYFDIDTAGKKDKPESYKKILSDIKMDKTPEKVLFLSDNPKELDAAKEAGVSVGLALRPGNVNVPNAIDYKQYFQLHKL